MEIITWLVLGLVAGVIAKYLMPGRDPGGFVVTTILGIIGAVVGGFIANQLGYRSATGLNLYSIAIAVGGSIVVLIAYRMIKKS